MTWADCRFRDLLDIHAPNLAVDVREAYVRELCELLRRRWFVDPQRASMYAVMRCWDAWVEERGGIRKVQNAEGD